MRPVPDGIYDVIVVDAEELDDGEIRIEVTITLGPRVGEIVALRGRHLQSRRAGLTARVPEELLGVCGTLRVRKGIPAFLPEE